MDTIQIFKKAAGLTWRYRLLWLFGFTLALTVGSALFWLPFAGDQDRVLMGNRIIFEYSTVYLPGEGVTIDFSAPDGPVVEIDGFEPGWDRALGQQVSLNDIWAFLISIGVVILISTLLMIILRYTSQAALIRMVDEHERSEKMVNLQASLRLGWSRVAVKLFLIDLTIALLLILFFGLLFALGISPFFLFGLEGIGQSVASVIGVSLLGLGGLALFGLITFGVSVVLSITRPVMYQACAVDGLGVGASLRQGFHLLKARFSEVILTWLVWLAVRLAWIIALIPVIIFLSPLLLLSMTVGVAVSALPCLLAVGIASQFVSQIFAWMIGVVFSLPLFLIVTFAPITFLSGLVEVFKSSFWTLSYREFRPLESPVVQPSEGTGVTRLDAALAG